MWFFLPDSNVAVDQNINKNNFEKPGFLVLPAFHFHTSRLSLASCGIGGIGGALAWTGRIGGGKVGFPNNPFVAVREPD